VCGIRGFIHLPAPVPSFERLKPSSRQARRSRDSHRSAAIGAKRRQPSSSAVGRHLVLPRERQRPGQEALRKDRRTHSGDDRVNLRSFAPNAQHPLQATARLCRFPLSSGWRLCREADRGCQPTCSASGLAQFTDKQKWQIEIELGKCSNSSRRQIGDIGRDGEAPLNHVTRVNAFQRAWQPWSR
jgi:hypothetical protein